MAQQRPSTSSGPDALLGSTTPRLWTPPLTDGPPGPCGCGCALTPQTSYGFNVTDFADRVLGQPLDPWQRWAAIHAGELLPDGRPRFRRILILVARQNGKTHLLKTLVLYWLYVDGWPLTVGMSTNLDYAREAWEAAVALAEDTPVLARQIPKHGIRRTNGEQTFTIAGRCRYKIAAANRKGGRSLSIDRLVADELREQTNWSAYAAAYPAMNARPHAQAWFISNQGDDTSVVLTSLRAQALKGKDPRLGLLEWSAPDETSLTDPASLRAGVAAANPNAGRRMDTDTLIGPAAAAAEQGGEEEAAYRTEVLCQRVAKMAPIVSAVDWAACGPTPYRQPRPLTEMRDRLALAVDVAPTAQHATVYAAAVDIDGIVHVDPVAAWDGPDATKQLRAELPGLVRKIRPRAIGWYPYGPAAAVAADLADRGGHAGWPPPGVKIEPITAETTAVCMGWAEQVIAGDLRHPSDHLLDTQLAGAERKPRGDGWIFARGDKTSHVDALYAAAGAAHLARRLPPPPKLGEVVAVQRR